MIIVLKMTGKGRHSRADYVSVHSFPTVEDASVFVIENTKPDEKYWSVASIVDPDEVIETYADSLL